MNKQERDFSSMENCVCFNLRRASRAITHFYGGELSPHGLLPTQTPILAALSSIAEADMAGLSEGLGMDRTTLLRNLRPLERDGLVKVMASGRGRKVVVSLTAKGREVLGEIMPDWLAAQQKVLETLGKERWGQILTDLETAGKALKLEPARSDSDQI